MTQEKLQQQYEQEYSKFQEETAFPHELPEEFTAWKREAMRFFTPTSLKMTVSDYEKLYKAKAPYMIGDMGTIISMLERSTMKVLDMVFEDYISYQMTIEQLAQQWKEIVEPENLALQRKYESMAKLSMGKKQIPLGRAEA
jgi:glycyl-tRNA synthetase alpha subunit